MTASDVFTSYLPILSYMLQMYEYELTAELLLEWVKLLYNKYCHLESFQREVGVVEDVQNMSEEELERVKGWLSGLFRIRFQDVVKALVECGIDDEEVWDFIQRLRTEVHTCVESTIHGLFDCSHVLLL